MIADLLTGLQDGLRLGLFAAVVGIGGPLLLTFLVEVVAAMRSLDRAIRGI